MAKIETQTEYGIYIMLLLFLCTMRPLFLSESALQFRGVVIQPLLFMPSASHILFSQREDIKLSCYAIEGECGCMFHEHCMTKWLLQRNSCPTHPDQQWKVVDD